MEGGQAPSWVEPQKRLQGQGARPQGFPAQPSTPRQAVRNWTHGTAAHYSMAFGHGARWTDSYTLATGRHPHLPWEPWQLTPKGLVAQPRVLRAAFIPRLAGNEEGKALENQDARMLGSKEQQISA